MKESYKVLYIVSSYLSLIILSILFIAQLKLRYKNSAFVFFRLAFFVLLALVFGLAGYYSVQQYLLWRSAGPPASYFLPPYQPLAYFMRYAFINFFLKYVLSGTAALLFLVAAKVLNRRLEKRLMRDEEPYLGAMTFLLLGHPLWILYLPLVLAAALVAAVWHRVFGGAGYRLPLYYLWLSSGMAIFVTAAIFRLI